MKKATHKRYSELKKELEKKRVLYTLKTNKLIKAINDKLGTVAISKIINKRNIISATIDGIHSKMARLDKGERELGQPLGGFEGRVGDGDII